MVLAAITALMLYFAPLITQSDCESTEGHKLESEFIQYTCKQNEFNPLATLLLNPEGQQIKVLMD